MKYLIVGLGNPGQQYENTRHNIGFKILDALAGASNVVFEPTRYGHVGQLKHRGRAILLLKPNTFMNLSGKAVNWHLQQAKIPLDRLLVITDDIALPFGKIRIRKKGSDGGHNGLKNIQECLGTTEYPRLRFGVGNDFFPGQQAEYVLSPWSEEEEKLLPNRIDLAAEAALAFATLGIERSMNMYNNR
ncbi:MAG: aminoacyl-tRNA hydrolase [Salibacteraceae bacterium]